MEDCIFCKIVAGQAQSWKVYETEDVYAFLDINPVSKYHTLIIPKTHYKDVFDIPNETLAELSKVVGKLSKWYKSKMGIDNIQIVNSSGSAAQQDVFHFHFHIVPRSLGDGQNIQWKTHPEWRNTFDDLISNLNLP